MSEVLLLTRPEVEALVRLSRSRIYALMDAEQFPRPLKISAQAVRWRRDEILDWIDSRPRAGQ